MIQINISNKVAYTFLAIVLIILMGGLVYAVTGVSHSADELDLSGVCSMANPKNCPLTGALSGAYVWQGATQAGDYGPLCKSDCKGKIYLAANDPQCKYYTDGYVLYYGGCPSAYKTCGSGKSGNNDWLYCAKEHTKSSTKLGEILINASS